MRKPSFPTLLAAVALLVACAVPGFAEEMAAEAPTAVMSDGLATAVADANFITHNLWMMLSAGLVFIMHLGFATLETGLCQSKNAVNVLFKNTLVPGVGLLLYCLCGFNLMYPGFADGDSGWLKFAGFGIPGFSTDPSVAGTDYNVAYTVWTDFLFQGMFAATAATIVSGAVAERIKLGSFFLFTILYVGLVYPIVGSWHWGYGWLSKMDVPFIDFAGSTLVHSVGGWGALAGILVLGPRRGKYVDGRIRPIVGHNLTLAVIGVFLLWLGWFGFNGGSVLSANPAAVSYVLVTTCLAAAAGGVAAAGASWIFGKKPDLTMALNGILAGLVAITANAHIASIPGAVIIGVVGGVIVYFSVLFFDQIRVDDPVGALSVHLVNGIWGTLACGIPFLLIEGTTSSFTTQLIGVVAYGIACFVSALVFWLVIKAIFGIRVSPEEEAEGLDAGEHGMHCYNGLEVR